MKMLIFFSQLFFLNFKYIKLIQFTILFQKSIPFCRTISRANPGACTVVWCLVKRMKVMAQLGDSEPPQNLFIANLIEICLSSQFLKFSGVLSNGHFLPPLFLALSYAPFLIPLIPSSLSPSPPLLLTPHSTFTCYHFI